MRPTPYRVERHRNNTSSPATALALNESLQCNKEIHIEYYRNGYLHEQYITVTSIDTQNKTIFCTDAFGLNARLKFEELIDIK
ncbi:YolD-like family protein [Bacillus mycoides]|uniref:YolD-like family protein n=1 Tax=Bacillus cereus group TaxID=86661 RepID=UPI0009B1A7C4|nr:YolD-like family protein [Bacillus cereus]